MMHAGLLKLPRHLVIHVSARVKSSIVHLVILTMQKLNELGNQVEVHVLVKVDSAHDIQIKARHCIIY